MSGIAGVPQLCLASGTLEIEGTTVGGDCAIADMETIANKTPIELNFILLPKK